MEITELLKQLRSTVFLLFTENGYSLLCGSMQKTRWYPIIINVDKNGFGKMETFPKELITTMIDIEYTLEVTPLFETFDFWDNPTAIFYIAKVVKEFQQKPFDEELLVAEEIYFEEDERID